MFRADQGQWLPTRPGRPLSRHEVRKGRVESGLSGLQPAADVDVLDHIHESASHLLPALREDLGRLDRLAVERSGAAFARLTDSDRARVVEEIRRAEPGFLEYLALQAATCYYQDDRVLLSLGVEPRPPFPKGYEVASGDLSLLDPVRKRGKLYRDTRDR